MGKSSLVAALVSLAAALSLTACSYSATFAFANETDENGTISLTLRRQNGRCPDVPRLALAPSSQLRRRWFRDPSPNWSPVASSEFTYSNLDCTVIVALRQRKAVSIARISDLVVEQGDWGPEFPVERLVFRSSSHFLDLDGSALLERFERRADLLFVASTQPPAA